MTDADRIEKKVLLRATRERVWQAISDSSQFGAWFGVMFDGPFVEGARLTGNSKEPTTLIVFELQEVPGGTLLTITESGFDQIPLARRASAFTANDGGWTMQMKLIEKYLAGQRAA
jgi:hypothetical protein